jgi:hypothetical protein
LAFREVNPETALLGGKTGTVMNSCVSAEQQEKIAYIPDRTLHMSLEPDVITTKGGWYENIQVYEM